MNTLEKKLFNALTREDSLIAHNEMLRDRVRALELKNAYLWIKIGSLEKLLEEVSDE